MQSYGAAKIRDLCTFAVGEVGVAGLANVHSHIDNICELFVQTKHNRKPSSSIEETVQNSHEASVASTFSRRREQKSFRSTRVAKYLCIRGFDYFV